ncbi:MAG TPA: hypothetical protein PKM88_11070 [bacterium]|nr:hypothetical protein [bacterium]
MSASGCHCRSSFVARNTVWQRVSSSVSQLRMATGECSTGGGGPPIPAIIIAVSCPMVAMMPGQYAHLSQQQMPLPAQVVEAFQEAVAYYGMSIVIAYARCITHGIKMNEGINEQKKAVTSGHWSPF